MIWKVAVVVVIAFTSTIGFTSEKPFPWPQRTPPSQRALRKSPVPLKEHKAYEILFKKVMRLEQEAQLREKEGKDGQRLRLLMPNRLGLNPVEAQILRETAIRCLSQAAALDEEASEIIRQFRGQYPEGRFDSRKGFPQAPLELHSMQSERDQIFMQGKAILQASFGPAVFAFYEQRMQELLKEVVETPAAGKKP